LTKMLESHEISEEKIT